MDGAIAVSRVSAAGRDADDQGQSTSRNAFGSDIENSMHLILLM
jgi:hypothetical protein